ncbi:UPF0481 protein [Acorus calamus]|uniref:UPF0481 protein n=1 Tax=Acorus calamus TaxID=4465 RepID=A0AAV9BZV6_ACOCL|nr:UPF0481 protein [Acorus calamus]
MISSNGVHISMDAEEKISSDEEGSVSIDPEEEEWARSFKSKLDESYVARWRREKRSIFRVPSVLRNENPAAYMPRVISIGPYHWGRADLMKMEKHKHRVTRHLFSARPDDLVAECFHKVRSLERRARSCYAEEIGMESREFTEMMIFDGCFIISFLISEYFEEGLLKVPRADKELMEEVEDIYSVPLVYEDLIKVENQIPFFILETLYDLLVYHVPDCTIIESVSDLAISNLRQLEPVGDRNIISTIGRDDIKHIHHLLHLFYQTIASVRRSADEFSGGISHRPPPSHTIKEKSKSGEGFSNWMRSATKLRESGVKFVRKGDCRFSSVSFRNGRMEIPTIRIFERTMSTLRNLIAFEQCFPDTNNEVTFFADLMDALIDTPRDVKVLQGAGILKIGLSNPKEVTQLFNRLCRHVYYDNSESYLREVYNRVNCYCDSSWHRQRAVLARKYFHNPWTIFFANIL